MAFLMLNDSKRTITCILPFRVELSIGCIGPSIWLAADTLSRIHLPDSEHWSVRENNSAIISEAFLRLRLFAWMNELVLHNICGVLGPIGGKCRKGTRNNPASAVPSKSTVADFKIQQLSIVPILLSLDKTWHFLLHLMSGNSGHQISSTIIIKKIAEIVEQVASSCENGDFYNNSSRFVSRTQHKNSRNSAFMCAVWLQSKSRLIPIRRMIIINDNITKHTLPHSNNSEN